MRMIRLVACLAAALVAAEGTPLAAERGAPTPDPTAPREVVAAYGGLRLHFEPNRGQAGGRAEFLARGRGYTALFTGTDVVFAPTDAGRGVRMRFEGASGNARAAAQQTMGGRSHYFIGDDPAGWRRDVPHHGRLVVRDLYPGVELRWRGIERRRLEYDLVVAPGARPEEISMTFDGACGVRVDEDGFLRVETPTGEFQHSPPRALQYVGRERVSVPCRFELRDGDRVGFGLGAHHDSLPVVIDPVIKYSTYLGGASGGDTAYAIAVDGNGAAYVAGAVGGTSSDFPTKNPYQGTIGSTNKRDAFVAKLNASGSALVFSTFFGGTDAERADGIAVTSTGEVCVAGMTRSSDLPTKSPAQSTYGGGSEDTWIARFSSSGSTLVYSTYHGGSDQDDTVNSCLAVDSSGAAYLAGWTRSTDFPVKSAIQGTKATTSQATDLFVSKFDANGARVYSTYYGGGTSSSGQSNPRIAVDGNGAAYVAASSVGTSQAFPTKNPLQASSAGGDDVVLLKINAAGSAVDFATYLGGSGNDRAGGIAVDASGAVYLTGSTLSTDFPTKGALDTSHNGNWDAFVTKIKADGSATVFSGYLGGGQIETAYGIGVDANGVAYVVGETRSSDFPTESPITGGGTYGGGTQDGFLSKVKADGSALLESTFLGGSANDVAQAVAVDSNGAAYMAGNTGSSDFPTSSSPIQSTRAGNGDGWIMKTGPVAPPDAPANLEVTASSDVRVDLAWDEVVDTTGFELERKVDSGVFAQIAEPAADATAYADTDVTGDTAYTYRLRAVNDVGPSDWSNEVTVVTIASPDQLGGNAVSNTRVDLMWRDRTSSEDGFEIQRKRAGDTDYLAVDSVGVDVTSFADTGVEPETTYEYRVRATKAPGASGWSNVAEVTTPPADPAGVIPTNVAGAVVRVRWSDLSDAETGYEVERGLGCPPAAYDLLATVGPDVTEYADGSALPESEYSYRVRAVNAHGHSEYTAPVCLTTPPKAPSGFAAAAASPSRIELSWQDNSTIEQGYEVQRTPAGRDDWEDVADLPADATEYLDVGVSQEAAFSYRVRAYDLNGRSANALAEGVSTPAALVVRSAKLTIPTGRAARRRKPTLVARGEMDVGGTQVELDGAATLWVGDTQVAIGGFASLRRGRVLRFDEDGVRLELKPSSRGASRVPFTLRVVGDPAAALERDGELFLRFRSGAFDAMGVVTLAAGTFNPARGRGTWIDPPLNLLSVVATPRRGSFRMKATFPPGDRPDVAPEVSVLLDIFEIGFESAAFKKRGPTKYVLSRRLGRVRQSVVLDYRRGTLAITLAGVTLQTYEPGTVLVPLAVSIGTTRLEDRPMLVTTSRSFRY